MAKDTFYFPHDYNARGDERIINLLRSLGWAGYGLYWALIEKLYESGGRISADFEAIAYDLRADKSQVESVASEFGLFYRHGSARLLASKSVDRRLQERRERQQRLSEFGRHGALRKKAMRNNENASHPSATLKPPLQNCKQETKGKEIKENVTVSGPPDTPDWICEWDEGKPTACREEKDGLRFCRYHILVAQAVSSGRPIPEKPKPEAKPAPRKETCISCKKVEPKRGELYCPKCWSEILAEKEQPL